MTGRVAGSSQFLNQATLANTQGISAQTNSVLNQAAGGISLLDVGRSLSPPGVGLSANARALNQQFLSSNAGTANQLFSATGGSGLTVDAARTQILALQSSVPTSRDTPDARADARADARGSNLDETV